MDGCNVYNRKKKKDIFTMGWESHKRIYLKENNWGEVEKIKIHFFWKKCRAQEQLKR